MLRTMSLFLLGAATLLSTEVNAYTVNAIQPGSTLEYQLAPDEPQLFINYMYWEITANCKVATEDQGDELFAEALAKQGKINDITLTKGHSLSMTVYNGDNLKITASPGAKVRITNRGERTVRVTCVA